MLKSLDRTACEAAGFALPAALLQRIADRAAAADRPGGTLKPDIDALAEAAAITAPLPVQHGGVGLGVEPLRTQACLTALRELGRANLSVARLFEGHINAIKLVALYGTPNQQSRVFNAVRQGLLLGVWGADGSTPLSFSADGPVIHLAGSKRFASGLHLVGEAVVTAQTADGPQLLIVRTADVERADAAAWQTSGMRATHSGSYLFDGLTVGRDALLGKPGDFLREPHFEGGVWRYCAAHLGGAEALYEEMLTQLTRAGRANDPHQERRIAEAAIACETARLWLTRATDRVEHPTGDPEAAAAYTLLAREATVGACTAVMATAEAALGMAAYDERHSVDRIRRDLGLFLRQAAPDAKRARAARALVARATLAERL